MKPTPLSAVCLIVLGVATSSPAAVTFSNLQFMSGSTAGAEVLNLASPGQNLNGTDYGYNIIDNSTGAKLVTTNGDANDITLTSSNSAGALGSATSFLSPSSASGRIRDDHGFTGAVNVSNPGSVNRNTVTLRFGSLMSVTDASFNFSSVNTAGIAWEYTVIQLLDLNGNEFNPVTGLAFIPGATSQYGVGAGFSGQAGAGNFVAASKGTVTGVGGNLVASGTNGTNDNIGTLNYALVGLAAGTQIGGIRWTTYLEDVRGTSNGNTNFTSSLLDFNITGSFVPEPGTSMLTLVTCLGLLVRRSRR